MIKAKTLTFKCEEVYYNKIVLEASKRNISLGEILRVAVAKGMRDILQEDTSNTIAGLKLIEEGLNMVKKDKV